MAIPMVRMACAATLLAGSALAQTPWLRYDAAAGTLPTAQGFFVRDDGWGPAATVRDGALWQGPTDFGTQHYWYANHEIDFARGVVVEGLINVTSSTFRLGDCAAGLRFGYYMGAVDVAGRFAYIGISDSRLFVLTSATQVPESGSELVSLPMQNQWRTLKMVIRENGIDLFADGNFLSHYPLGAVGEARGASRMLFGDGTACGSSRTQLRWVQVGPLAECRADFNRDGFVDFSDYDDFVTCFEGGSCPADRTADINEDGFVDMFDYDDFVAAFEWGCTADGGGGGGGPVGG